MGGKHRPFKHRGKAYHRLFIYCYCTYKLALSPAGPESSGTRKAVTYSKFFNAMPQFAGIARKLPELEEYTIFFVPAPPEQFTRQLFLVDNNRDSRTDRFPFQIEL